MLRIHTLKALLVIFSGMFFGLVNAATVEFRYLATLESTTSNSEAVFYFAIDNVAEGSTYIDMNDVNIEDIRASILLDGSLVALDVLTTATYGININSVTQTAYFDYATFSFQMSEAQTNPGVETQWQLGIYDNYYLGCRTCFTTTTLRNVATDERFVRKYVGSFAVVPVPAAVWLFVSALGILGLRAGSHT